MCCFMCYNVKNNVIIVISWNEVYKKKLIPNIWATLRPSINEMFLTSWFSSLSKGAKWRKQIAKNFVQWIRPRNNMLVFPKVVGLWFFHTRRKWHKSARGDWFGLIACPWYKSVNKSPFIGDGHGWMASKAVIICFPPFPYCHPVFMLNNGLFAYTAFQRHCGERTVIWYQCVRGVRAPADRSFSDK